MRTYAPTHIHLYMYMYEYKPKSQQTFLDATVSACTHFSSMHLIVHWFKGCSEMAGRVEILKLRFEIAKNSELCSLVIGSHKSAYLRLQYISGIYHRLLRGGSPPVH